MVLSIIAFETDVTDLSQLSYRVSLY